MVAGLALHSHQRTGRHHRRLDRGDRFWFTGPVFYGDTVTTFEVWIAEQHDETCTIIWEASAHNEDASKFLKARVILKFPRRKPA